MRQASSSYHNAGQTARPFLLEAKYKQAPLTNASPIMPWLNSFLATVGAYDGFSITIYYYTSEPQTHPNIVVSISPRY